jgi:transposase InsO family protein
VDGVKVTGTAPSTVKCETCALTKAQHAVSRRLEREEPAEEPLGRVGYDLIPMNESYNKDSWVSHFRCFRTGADFVYTYSHKNDAVAVIEEFLNMAKTRYGATTRFIRTDDEPTLGKKYKDVLAERGITAERTAPYTPAQNGRTERARGVLTLRTRALRIAAKLPSMLWPKTFKAAGYLNK